MKKLLFLAIAGFFAFQACDLISDETETVVFNKEKAGILHNQLLDQVATQVHIGRASDEEISTAISDLIISQVPEKERGELRAELNATPHANLGIYADFNEWLSSETRALSSVEKQYLQRLAQLGEAASHQENFDFETAVGDLQDEVNASTEKFRKESIVNALSIAKYSCRYWKAAIVDADHPYHRTQPHSDPRIIIPTIPYCVWRDIMGYINAIEGNAPEQVAMNEGAYQSAICGG